MTQPHELDDGEQEDPVVESAGGISNVRWYVDKTDDPRKHLYQLMLVQKVEGEYGHPMTLTQLVREGFVSDDSIRAAAVLQSDDVARLRTGVDPEGQEFEVWLKRVDGGE